LALDFKAQVTGAMFTSKRHNSAEAHQLALMSSTRIPSLDGIRALSVLMVLVGHFAYSAGSPVRNSWWTDTYAHYGVRIFFVISGFLITTLLERERGKTGKIDLKQFYLRRAYRILPVAYTYIIVVALFSRGAFGARELTLAFTFLSSYAVDLPWRLSHLWSLSVEEQFYLVWPVAAALGGALSRRFALFAIIFSPIFRFALNKHGMYLGALWFFPSVADSLASGCLLALYQPKLRCLRSFFSWRGFPLIWAITLLIPVFAHLLLHSRQTLLIWPLPQFLGHSAISIFNLGVVLCIQSAIVAPPRLLNARIPVWIGTLSYSLYLWQMPFANAHVHSWATTFPANIVLAFLAAVASFYAVEQPFLRLRKRRAQPMPLRSAGAAELQSTRREQVA
jgi:peptidoglycan/LPS O-acetylase OafA/YrhL